MHDRCSSEQRWQQALEWFQSLEMGRRKAELSAIIRPIYDSLRQAPDLEAMHRLYLDPADAATALDLARASFPQNEHLWDLSRTRDVAYGLRLVELRRGAGQEG
ncbi:MAG: hypothetical protein M3281_01535 [Chloroflexota bacterium]|nr:hypothetical protein [Chloroflexota bacterium]